MVQAENTTCAPGKAGSQDTPCRLMWHNKAPSTPYTCKERKPEPTQTSRPDCEFIRNTGEGIASQDAAMSPILSMDILQDISLDFLNKKEGIKKEQGDQKTHKR